MATHRAWSYVRALLGIKGKDGSTIAAPGNEVPVEDTAVKAVLDNIYDAVDDLELSVDNIDIDMDDLENLITELNSNIGDVTDPDTADTVIGTLKALESKLTELDGAFDGTDFATETTLNDIKTAVQLLDDIVANGRAKTSPIVGEDGVDGGAGATTTKTTRVTQATDSLIGTKGKDGSTIAGSGNPSSVEDEALFNAIASYNPGNQVYTDTQIPASLGVSEDFTGSGWVPITHAGSFLFLIAGLEDFDTVELEWSDDGVNPNGAVTTAVNDPTEAGPFTYSVYVEISSLFINGAYFRTHIINGTTAQSPGDPPGGTGLTGIMSVGKFPYIPLIGVSENISNLSSAILCRVIPAAVDNNGNLVNIRASNTGALRVENENAPGNHAGFMPTMGYDDENLNYVFSAGQGPTDIQELINASTGSGSVTLSASQGVALFSTGTDAGAESYFMSGATFDYDSGHPQRQAQSFILPELQGDEIVYFGSCDATLDNIVGWKVVAGVSGNEISLYHRREGIDEHDVAQTNWAIDNCLGEDDSQFTRSGTPEALDTTQRNVYYTDWEWFGADVFEYGVKAPNKNRVNVHVLEHPNNGTQSTVPDPNLRLFVYVKNDPAAPRDVQVKSGSWNGGKFTNRTKVDVETISDDLHLKTPNTRSVQQFTVGNDPVHINPTKLSNLRALSISVDGNFRAALGFDENMLFNTASHHIQPNSGIDLMTDPSWDWWMLTEGGVGDSNVQTLEGTATGTATTPTNAETSDDAYAVLDADGEEVEVDTFAITPTESSVLKLELIAEMNKATSPATKTVAFQEVQTGTTTGATQVSSGSLAGGTAQLYVAWVTRNADTEVTSITAGGNSFTKLGLTVENDSDGLFMDCWYAYGTFTAGAATAQYVDSTNANISVHRYTNAHPTTPIQDYETQFGTGVTPTTPAVDVTDLGYIAMGVGHRTLSGVAGATYTERSDVTVSTGSNRNTLGTETKAITSTGTDTPTYTITSDEWAAFAVSILPAPTTNPTVDVWYELSAVQGATMDTFEVTGTDSDYVVDITGDEAWGFSDIPNITAYATANTVVDAAANLDFLGLRVTESSGPTVRVTVLQLGGDN